MDVDELFEKMKTPAIGAFAGAWSNVQNYTLPELKKLAMTLVDIEKGVAGNYYTRESADVLLRMQLRATQTVLVATTALTLLEVERALNAILAAIKDFVNGALGWTLL